MRILAGATALTRMGGRLDDEGGDSRRESERTKPEIACLDATYMGVGKKGTCPAIEEMWITAPGFRRDKKCEMASWVSRIGCVRLMSSIR